MSYYWYPHNNQLKFVNEYGNAVTLSPVTVRYRKRLNNIILDSDHPSFGSGLSVEATRDDGLSIETTKVGDIADPRVPMAPIIIAPQNGSSGLSLLETILEWIPSNNPASALPTYYTVIASKIEDNIYSDFMLETTETKIDFNELRNGSDEAPTPVYGDRWYWTVAANNKYGQGDAAPISTFTFMVEPGEPPGSLDPPLLLTPVDGATNVPIMPTFSWGAVNDAAGYILSYWPKDETSLQKGIYCTETKFTLSLPLVYDAEYEWTVVAYNGSVMSAEATHRSFTVVSKPLGAEWEEQDDGLDTDTQLAALYLALSRACDLCGGDAKTSKYFYDKFNYMQKELRIKYNSSKYRNITIRPYSY